MTSQCVCPNELKQLIMIEYPGFVKNPDKALDTLGGLETINTVNESQKERLELKFRKSDPFAHPAYGDRVPKKCLVLRIRKRKSNSPTTSTAPDAKEEFQLNVVGKIQTSFRFDTMAEFQWLPMQRVNPTEHIKSDELQSGIVIERSPESLDPKYSSILDDVLPIKNPFDNTLKSFNPDSPLLLMPAVFSRFDTPREIHQPHPKFRSKEMRDEFERQQSLSIIGRTRKKRSTMSYLLNYNDPIPEKAPEKLVRERSMLSAQERLLIPKLKRCFESQKVWSKAALCYELNCSTLDIKFILPLLAFHYLNGPFRALWVGYGYDPHKDSSSKVLQTLDFRVKNSHDQQEYSRRCINQYQLPLRKNADKVRSKRQVDLKSMLYNSYSGYVEALDDPLVGMKGRLVHLPITEEMCKFRKDLIPVARQLIYQLKDIEVEEVQMIVHSNDGREPQECSERDGWLPEGTIDRIRKIMTKALNETVGAMTSQLEEGTS